jgi:VanZ family protein
MLRYIIRNYTSGVVFGAIVLIISVLPVSAEETPSFLSFPGADKVVHSAIYFVFSGLLTWDYLRINSVIKKKHILLMGCLLTYSIIIEIIQHFITPYRSGEKLDVLANIVGILAGAFSVYLYKKYIIPKIKY